MSKEEKEKRKKVKYDILSDVKCTCGCNRYLKQNVIMRNPAARLCYFSHLLTKGKKTIFTGSILDKRTNKRTKRYEEVEKLLSKHKKK